MAFFKGINYFYNLEYNYGYKKLDIKYENDLHLDLLILNICKSLIWTPIQGPFQLWRREYISHKKTEHKGLNRKYSIIIFLILRIY